VFQAEVFFVKSQPVRNLTFGGQMMSMRDPELDVRVTPRAYGTYAMVVVDPVRFIIAYAGQTAHGDNDEVTAWLRQRLFQGLGKTLAGFLKTGQTTFMDLGGFAPDLAAAMARDSPDFGEIGVRVLEIGELTISVSEDDRARIDELQDQMATAKLQVRMAKVGIAEAEARAQERQFELDQRFANDARYVGQLAGTYQGYAAGRAMIGAGDGMAEGGAAGGVAALGAQMAVGMGMGSWMQQPLAAGHPGAFANAAEVVTCGACALRVPAGKFCQECGKPLQAVKTAGRRCACGHELGAAKFCANCGAATA
jgi:membrane protease subunit (stomatin/prohibitin family)